MSETEGKLCRLSASLGRAEECAGPWCPFWEHGGAALPGACGLQRLGLDLEDRAVARHLLDLRTLLEQARSEEEAAAARAQIAQLVPPDLVDDDGS